MNNNETKENPATEEEVLQNLLERVKISEPEGVMQAVCAYSDFKRAMDIKVVEHNIV